jgi:hypothetical protein
VENDEDKENAGTMKGKVTSAVAVEPAKHNILFNQLNTTSG